jgi:DNA-binding LytR/AlgR family response regulator
MDCIIVEDNELAILSIKKCIERNGNIQIKKIFSSAEEASAYLINDVCDVLFLDVEMGNMSGIDLLKQLINAPNIIIISAKPDYAAEAFNFDVADYIVKPLTYERFEKAIQKVKTIQENLQTSSKDFFYLKQQQKMVQLFFKDVIYIEALADYVNIHTATTRYTILSTMKAVENQFPKKDFMRVHRSFIVRLDKIREIEENTITVEGKLIPISRSNKEEFQKKINLI